MKYSVSAPATAPLASARAQPRLPVQQQASLFLKRSVGSRLRSLLETVAVVIAMAALAGCAEDPAGTVVLDNGTVSRWEHMQGRWFLVNYWAEWCAPCRREIPELNEIHHESESTNVYVVGVNFDGIQGAALETLKDQMGIEFPQLREDPSPHWNQSAPTILPTTYVINPQGELTNVLVGPQTVDSLMALTE